MRALISVSDKTGIVEFAKSLRKLNISIISTGGTHKALKEAGVEVTEVSEVTGFPECLDGRVKTLHPGIHAGLLAIRSNPEHMARLKELNIDTIDLVVVNLYPFKQTILKPGVAFAEAIENIDIGGPTMLRAAAKNYRDVSVITDPADYERVLNELENYGGVGIRTNLYLAAKVFALTANYDAMIARYLGDSAGLDRFPETLTLTYEKVQSMRYGENPHQKAAFYREPVRPAGTLADAVQLHGKELSFNNINDAHGALELLKEFDEPTAVASKHANPCGVGSAENIYDAYMKAYNSDPVSIFGGIIALNREVDAATASELAKIFVEIIVAPSFSPEAMEILTAKKNLRLLTIDGIENKQPKTAFDLKKVAGGLLVQSVDAELLPPDVKIVTKRAPTGAEFEDLKFAWKIVKYAKSNGIALARDKQSIGVGPGQVNRIWATKQAIEHGIEALGEGAAKGAALASDAFFPFPDCAETAAAAGITAIIQPGGSIKDAESIEVCDKHGIAMVFTGMRHFRH